MILILLKPKLKNRKLIKINFRFEVVKFKIMKLFIYFRFAAGKHQ